MTQRSRRTDPATPDPATPDPAKPDAAGGLDRRSALARLGLGVAVAYSAPTVLHLDRTANAVVVPTPCPKGTDPKTAPWCQRRDR